MSGQLLELKNITKRFGETDVLNGITLSIEKGEFITFLGASGCGKTTTLRIIAGLEQPDSGSVFLEMCIRDRGIPLSPSMEAVRADPSPQTKAPAPRLICIWKEKSVPRMLSPNRPFSSA